MSNSSLDINWTFGFSKDIVNSVHSLCTPDRNALFLLSSHSGVIYDFENRKQMILQGHCNIITCCAIDKTKRWIVTADAGIEPLMVIWDSFTYLPVKTFISPHQYGILALDISDDGLYLATLSAVPTGETGYECDQELAIWAWTQPDDYPIQKKIINLTSQNGHTPPLFHSVKFNRSNGYELVTTSNNQVLYWDWSDFSLDFYSGKLSKVDIGNFNGDMTATVFLPETDSALTATSHGYIIVWEGKMLKSKKNSEHESAALAGKTVKTAIKVVKLLECGVQLLDISPNNYLVVGCSDGAVRFYDFYLRLEAWFEDINAGPISSLSFSLETSPFSINEAGAPGLRFWTPNFIVSTRKGLVVGIESMIFEEIVKENRRGTLLMQGLGDACVSIACHPSLPIVGFLTKNGVLQIWNYELKLLMNLREFSILNAGNNNGSTAGSAGAGSIVRDFVFHPQGHLIAVAFTNGLIKLIHSETLVDLQTFSPSTDGVLKLKFSLRGNFLAAYDELNHVILIKKDEDLPLDKSGSISAPHSLTNISNPSGTAGGAAGSGMPHYTYLGRAKVHKERISDIEFGIRDNNSAYETLISVSQDKNIIEYDLLNTTSSTGILLLKVLLMNNLSASKFKVDSSAVPLSLFFLPRHHLDVEDRFVVSCNDFKFREFNLDNKNKRKTTLAPRYGLPPNKIIVINDSIQFLLPPGSSQAAASQSSGSSVSSNSPPPPVIPNPSSYISGSYVFSTGNRVIGIGQFPLDGNPLNSLGIVAHPGEITSIAASFDGKYLFSAGGSDLSINMWSLTYSMLNKLEKDMVAENDISPYLSLLDGGPGGELHETIIDYFYYCQLRNIGQNSGAAKDNQNPGSSEKAGGSLAISTANPANNILMDDNDIMEARELKGLIPLEEIPALFRGIGYYPSEEDVANIINEVKFKEFMVTGKTQDFIGLDEFIKLYINHRPVVPLEKQQIDHAFSVIAKYLSKNKAPPTASNNNTLQNRDLYYSDYGASTMSAPPTASQASTANTNSSLVTWKELKDLLLNYGEAIDSGDLETYFTALVGNEQGPFYSNEAVDADSFAEKVLGFEEN